MAVKPKQVWRIFHYSARFEPKTASRHFYESSLDFTKDFVFDGGSDEGAGYQRQFALLSRGDGIENCTLYGCYRFLINLASQSSRAYRGYLLGPDKTPLSDAQIGKLLHIPTIEMKRMLKRFASVKLIERVDLPEFDLSLNRSDEWDEDEKAHEQTKKKPSKTGNRKHTKRNQTQSNAEARTPLTNDKRQGEGKATIGLTASACKEKTNGNGKKDGQVQSPEEPGEMELLSRTPTSPTTTPPLSSRKPSETDAQGASRVIPFTSGSPLRSDYSRAGLSYGRRVYLTLGYTWDLDSPEAAREICSFASKHDQICARLSGLSPPESDALLNRGLKEAGRIGKRKSAKNRGAVWNSLIDKLADARRKVMAS